MNSLVLNCTKIPIGLAIVLDLALNYKCPHSIAGVQETWSNTFLFPLNNRDYKMTDIFVTFGCLEVDSSETYAGFGFLLF